MVTSMPQAPDTKPPPGDLPRGPQPSQAGSVAQLVEAREAAGMTSADVAARLGMTVRQIEYLESGAWDRLPGRPFIVSALRAYGRAVRVDVELLVNSVRGSVQTAETLKPVAQLDQPMPRRGALGFGGGGSGSFRTWLIFLLILILALAFFYGGGATYLGMSAPPIEGGRRGDVQTRNGNLTKPAPPAKADSSGTASGLNGAASAAPGASGGSSPGSSSASSAATDTVVSGQAQASQGQSGSGQSASGQSTSGQSGSGQRSSAPSSVAPGQTLIASTPRDATVIAPEPAAQPISGRAGPVQAGGAGSPAPEGAASRAAGTGPSVPAPGAIAADLVLSFEIESWIEIKDADGRVLVIGTERPGSSRAVEGRAPFSLIIGNAQGVRLSYRGRPVNLEPHTQRGIARLVVE